MIMNSLKIKMDGFFSAKFLTLWRTIVIKESNDKQVERIEISPPAFSTGKLGYFITFLIPAYYLYWYAKLEIHSKVLNDFLFYTFLATFGLLIYDVFLRKEYMTFEKDKITKQICWTFPFYTLNLYSNTFDWNLIKSITFNSFGSTLFINDFEKKSIYLGTLDHAQFEILKPIFLSLLEQTTDNPKRINNFFEMK